METFLKEITVENVEFITRLFQWKIIIIIVLPYMYYHLMNISVELLHF